MAGRRKKRTVSEEIDLVAYQATLAEEYLADYVGTIYEKVGMEATLTALMRLAAKGISLTEDLTDKDRTALLKECKRCLDQSAKRYRILQQGADEHIN